MTHGKEFSLGLVFSCNILGFVILTVVTLLSICFITASLSFKLMDKSINGFLTLSLMACKGNTGDDK
jgi:hypothetical protein